MRKIKQDKIFWYYLLTYLAVLFIPMVICCFYYIYMLSLIAEDDIRAKESELSHAVVLVDNVLDEFEYLGDSIAANSYVNGFSRRTNVFDYPNTYRVYELRASLPDLYQMNQSIFSYFIFFDQSEMVIGKNAAYTYEEFYNLYMHADKYAGFKDWYTHIKEEKVLYGLSPIEKYYYTKDEKDVYLKLCYYERPLMSTSAESSSRIQIYMEESALEEMLPVPVEGGIRFMEDMSGQLLYFRQDISEEPWQQEKILELREQIQEEKKGNRLKIRFGGEEYEVVKYVSSRSGLTYYELLPQDVVMKRVFSTLLVSGVFILAGAVTGILLSYYMSMRSVTPINDILRQVSRSTEHFEGHQSVFSSLKTTFNYLAATNTKLADAIESQRPYLRNAFMNRLIYGDFKADGEAEKIAEHVGFEWRDRVFGVVLFRFHLFPGDVREEDMKLMCSCILSLMEVIEKEVPDSLYTSLGEEQVVLLLGIAKERESLFQEEVEEIILRIRENISFSIAEKLFAYGGNRVETLEQVYESYQNASYMIFDENDQIENPIIWYRESAGDVLKYPPQDLQVRLGHFVMAGDGRGLHDALEEIMKKYIIENNLPVYLQQMLLSELQSVIFRIIGRIGMGEEDYRNYYAKLEENHNAPLITQFISTLNLYRQVCEYVDRQMHRGMFDMNSSEVTAYIDTHFGDPELCLASVAAHFKLSEGYLSQMFKKTYGTNFSTYVETVRVDKAKDFLMNTNLPVSEISELVGYLAQNTFGRAFKRVTGLSPSEYRKKKRVST